MRMGVNLFAHVDTPDLTETVSAHTSQFVNQIDRDNMLSSWAAVLVFDTWQDVSLLLDNFTTDCLVCGVMGQSEKGSIVTGWWKGGRVGRTLCLFSGTKTEVQIGEFELKL